MRWPGAPGLALEIWAKFVRSTNLAMLDSEVLI